MTADLLTIYAAVVEYGLDDAVRHRVARLLRGREAPESAKRRKLYTRADIEKAIRYDKEARALLAPSADLFYCQICHRAFISAATLQSHCERDHKEPV